jgi:serralysin
MRMVTIEAWGAFAFGLIIGWFVYFINRYRKGDVSLTDITALIGAIGGGAVTALFPQSGLLFAAYGIGLAVGFFGYFLILIVLVSISDNFTSDWFLDGRRKKPVDPFEIPGETRPTLAPMAPQPGTNGQFIGQNPAAMVVPVRFEQVSAPPRPQAMPAPAAVHATAASADDPDWFCAALEPRDKLTGEPPEVRGRAALLNAAYWGAGRTLNVGFMGGSDALRQRVATIARRWSEIGAGINFNFWLPQESKPGDADIRVAFEQDGSSWSYVGNEALTISRDQPTMNLGWLTETLSEDEARSVILHEFGHAIGLIHEHQNPHRQVQWNKPRVEHDLSGPPNNWDQQTIDFNMFKLYDAHDLFASQVDPDSIMMYPIPKRWTLDGFTVGFNADLSATDIQLIRAAYPRTGM